MTFKNYYKVLGLKDFASLADIKKAYRSQAFRYHPDHDKGGKSGAERFHEIKEAYQVLIDPIKKRHFDALLQANNIYALAYGFGKYTIPQQEPVTEEKEEQKVSIPQSNWNAVLKPLILVLITIALMYLIMKPPSWLAKVLSGKQPAEKTINR